MVDPEDVGALSSGLQQLLQDPHRMRELSRLGRGRAEEFEPDAIVARYESILKSVADPLRSAAAP